MIQGANKTRKRIIIIGSITISLIVVSFVGFTIYVNGLLNLIDRGEVPGDSSFNTSEYTITESIDASISDYTNPSKIVDETTEQQVTTTETTIDPRIIDAKKQQQEALEIPVRSDSSVYNILLIGSDRQAGETTGRSDSMIILSINKKTRKLHLVSLMRAIYVNIPEHGFGLLNASYSYGGSRMLRQTIENNLRVHIDKYIMVDFAGFEAAINAFGGLEINLTEKETEHLNSEYGATFTPGINHLDGMMVLYYSRIRYIDSDFVRTSRQRYVIELLFQKAMTLSPDDLDTLARTILPLIKTNMDDNEILSLALGALDYKDYSIRQLMIPVKNTYEIMYINGAEVVKFDYQDNIEALQDFLYDD